MAQFLFVLRDHDNEKATRCFQFAKIAHAKGHQVNLFFIDSGVDWTMKKQDGSRETDTGDSRRLPALPGRAERAGRDLHSLRQKQRTRRGRFSQQ